MIVEIILEALLLLFFVFDIWSNAQLVKSKNRNTGAREAYTKALEEQNRVLKKLIFGSAKKDGTDENNQDSTQNV